MDRVMTEHPTEFHAAIRMFLDGNFQRGQVEAYVDALLPCLEADVATDIRKRATNTEYLGRVDELFDFVDGRRAVLEAFLAAR
jgi:hypothetical protein